MSFSHSELSHGGFSILTPLLQQFFDAWIALHFDLVHVGTVTTNFEEDMVLMET